MVTLIERYLTEDIEAVRRQYSYIPEEDFNRIIRLDPTFDENRDSVGKYGKWLLNLYKKEPDAYNNPNLPKLLAKYDELKNDRRYNIEKDIMRLRNTNDLENAIGNVETNTLSKKQAQRQAKKDNNYDLVFETNDYWVFVPKNHEGDMTLASYGGSKKALWCTAADSENGRWRYNQYLEDGGCYYVLINKNDYNDKYQFHFESEQFMDVNNCEIDYNMFCKGQEGLYEFFISDENNRNKFNKRHKALTKFKVFNLDLNKNIDEQMNRERTITVSGEYFAQCLEYYLFGCDQDFVNCICEYAKNGVVDDENVKFYGNGYPHDFDGISIEEDSGLFYLLLNKGLTDEMIDDFCSDTGGFLRKIEDVDYTDIDADEYEDIRPFLVHVLRKASFEARKKASTMYILKSFDDSIADVGIRKNSDQTYTILFTYQQISDAFAYSIARNIEDYVFEEVIKYYISEYLLEECYFRRGLSNNDIVLEEDDLVEHLIDVLENS